MFNPRHSFISTSSATTYPSTLSPPKSLSKPLSSPTSPRHSTRLHRSSKRNLRTSASSNALRTITEDAKVRTTGTPSGQAQVLPAKRSEGPVKPNMTTVSTPPTADLPTARPRSQNAVSGLPNSRPSSVDSVKAWAQEVSADSQPARSASAIPPPVTVVKAKTSRDRIGIASVRPASTPATGLGLDTGTPQPPPQPSGEPVKRDERIALPRKPQPIDINPRRNESMADEWEKELIQSAKNLRFEPLQEDKGKSREVEKDLEWERSGRWQAEVDPTREAEDRKRRDAGREIACPPTRPRAPIRAAANGVTSVHIGVRPRLHPARADSSMSVNQPDSTLQAPLGSPLGSSQAPNLPESSGSAGLDRVTRLEKARAEYEAWLSKKEEREAGVGQPHDYGAKDWASKGRVPARPSALTSMGSESSTMAQAQMQPPPILVRAVSNDRLAEVEEPVLITPSSGSPHPHMVFPDPGHLQDVVSGRQGGTLSAQPSINNLHAAYNEPPLPMQIPPDGFSGQEYPFPHQPYPYAYPFDPSYAGYGYDPAMYQHYWSNPSWYAPQYDWNQAACGPNQPPGEESNHQRETVHFDDTPAGTGTDVNNKGPFDPIHPDA